MGLDVQKQIEEINQMYQEADTGQYFSVLVAGLFGTGKTTLIGTAPKPVLIDSFDPRGTLVLRDQIKAGEVYVRTYWSEFSKSPSEYVKWERQWESDLKSGFFSNFGTYAIDSLTTLLEAMSNRVAQKNGRHEGKLAIQDYIPIYNTVRDIIKMSSAQECNFIATAHLVNQQDELTGEVIAELDTYKTLKSRVPILFTEKYVLQTKETSTGVERYLLTQPKGRYRASTQLGKDGIFDREEIPDLKLLMQKAGLDVSDKPLFKKE